jgi:hypothetical protein
MAVIVVLLVGYLVHRVLRRRRQRAAEPF